MWQHSFTKEERKEGSVDKGNESSVTPLISDKHFMCGKVVESKTYLFVCLCAIKNKNQASVHLKKLHVSTCSLKSGFENKLYFWIFFRPEVNLKKYTGCLKEIEISRTPYNILSSPDFVGLTKGCTLEVSRTSIYFGLNRYKCFLVSNFRTKHLNSDSIQDVFSCIYWSNVNVSTGIFKRKMDESD